MDLEYAVGKVTIDTRSYAVKSHRRKQQNPAIRFNADGTEWTIIGLQPGTVDSGGKDDVDHLDLYILIDDLCDQLATMPVPSAAAARRSATTNPWGTEGLGKKAIQPGRTRARLEIEHAEMRFAAHHQRAETADNPLPAFNIDFQLAPYPNPINRTRSKIQVHFGLDASWVARNDGRIRNSQATLIMTHAQYSTVHGALMQIYANR